MLHTNIAGLFVSECVCVESCVNSACVSRCAKVAFLRCTSSLLLIQRPIAPLPPYDTSRLLFVLSAPPSLSGFGGLAAAGCWRLSDGEEEQGDGEGG